MRAALETDSQLGAVVPPIHLTSTFAFAGYGQKRDYDYSRSGNPTRDALAGALADLEGGAGAVVTASGMAAVTLVAQLFRPDAARRRPARLLWRHLSALQCAARARRPAGALRGLRTAAARLKRRSAERPALLWIETPSNPLLRIVDIARAARAGRAAGALVVADNTFLSPVWQKPLALGADAVVHSTTKYLNGHSDVVGGAVIAAQHANCTSSSPGGATASARPARRFDSLPDAARPAHAARAHAGARRECSTSRRACSAAHPARGARLLSRACRSIRATRSHASSSRASARWSASSSTAGLRSVRAFLDALKLFSLAESLGGVESLVAHPASMTHAAMAPEARDARRASPTTCCACRSASRTAEDLVRDLEQALASMRDERDEKKKAGGYAGLPGRDPSSLSP